MNLPGFCVELVRHAGTTVRDNLVIAKWVKATDNRAHEIR
jgi:hypothetical protein